MADQPQVLNPLAYSPNDFAAAVGLGRSTIFDAIKHGELATVTPVVAGRRLKRKLITAEAGKAWLDSFPHDGEESKKKPGAEPGNRSEIDIGNSNQLKGGHNNV